MKALTDPRRLLVISNGTAEDLIGAALLRELARLRQVRALVLPLVGEGRAYHSLPFVEHQASPLPLPSGGFPFGSAENLRADMQAGLISESLRQWRWGWEAGQIATQVVVVGDAYALMVGTVAARLAGISLTHVQPLLSAYYMQGLGLGALRELNALGANIPMPYELKLARRARAVYVRDAPTAAYYQARGVAARCAGSFALDILGLPERETKLRSPVVALVPGSRDDHRFSLPLMLRAVAALSCQHDIEAVAALAHLWEEVQLPSGWTLSPQDSQTAWATGDGVRVQLWRGSFSAVAHQATIAFGTSGTANEQLAGLGVPVVGFATPGPQYTAGFAGRQQRLLGLALTLCPPDPQALTQAALQLLTSPQMRQAASEDGKKRIGTPGALAVIARELP